MDYNEEQLSAITVNCTNSIFSFSERVLTDENIHEDVYFYTWSKTQFYAESHLKQTYHGNPTWARNTTAQLQAHGLYLAAKIVLHALLPLQKRKEGTMLVKQHRLLLLGDLCSHSRCVTADGEQERMGNPYNVVLTGGLNRLAHKSVKAGPSRACNVSTVYEGGLLMAVNF